MAVKINLKLQTPTIELKIVAKDPSGASDTILVGFKRYHFDEAKAKFEALGAAESETLTDSILKEEIVYIKQMKLSLEDEEGKAKDLVIVDTRNQKPVEFLWESPEECLSVLVDVLLNSAPYRNSLIDAMIKALLNMKVGDDVAKNS